MSQLPIGQLLLTCWTCRPHEDQVRHKLRVLGRTPCLLALLVIPRGLEKSLKCWSNLRKASGACSSPTYSLLTTKPGLATPLVTSSDRIGATFCVSALPTLILSDLPSAMIDPHGVPLLSGWDMYTPGTPIPPLSDAILTASVSTKV